MTADKLLCMVDDISNQAFIGDITAETALERIKLLLTNCLTCGMQSPG